MAMSGAVADDDGRVRLTAADAVEEEFVFQFAAYTMGGLSVQLVRTPQSQEAAIARTGRKRLNPVVAVLSACYPPWPEYASLTDFEFLLKDFDDDPRATTQATICKQLIEQGVLVPARPSDVECPMGPLPRRASCCKGLTL